MKPLLVLDIETSGNGRHKNNNRILAIGGCVIFPSMILNKLNAPIIQPSTNSQEHTPSLVFTADDVSSEHTFLKYIHDEEALNTIDHNKVPQSIWYEPPTSRFWFRETPQARVSLNKMLSMMRASEDDAQSVMAQLETWLSQMIAAYPDLVFASDTSNNDFAWLDHYRLKYLDLPSFNFIKQGTYQNPIDLSCYFSGLCGSTLGNFKRLRPFDDICMRYRLRKPDICIPHDHCPLHDALLLGIQAMYVMTFFSLQQVTTLEPNHNNINAR